jgi:hypothetical protein
MYCLETFQNFCHKDLREIAIEICKKEHDIKLELDYEKDRSYCSWKMTIQWN